MLDINMKFNQGILIIRLKGNLNKETSQTLRKEIDQMIKNNGIKYVLINFKNLKNIDNEGLKIIKECYNSVIKNKGKLILCGIEKLFEYNTYITDNLYQVNEEVQAYEIVNI